MKILGQFLLQINSLLSGKGIDIAMRMGVLQHGSVIALKVRDSLRLTLAAPACLGPSGPGLLVSLASSAVIACSDGSDSNGDSGFTLPGCAASPRVRRHSQPSPARGNLADGDAALSGIAMIRCEKLLTSTYRRKEHPGMKKLKNEKELVKKAIAAGMKYGEERGVVEFEPTDSATEKIEYIYRLLVHDKIIQPLPQDQVSQLSMKHRLAMWAQKLD
ncbi:MAG: DUF5062 family protein [Halieaceae bacterium]|nr:DUF5062 family protein [Halieaceae bacterium]